MSYTCNKISTLEKYVVVYYPYFFYDHRIFDSEKNLCYIATNFVEWHLSTLKLYLLFFDKVLIGVEHLVSTPYEFLIKKFIQLFNNRDWKFLIERNFIVLSIWSGPIDKKLISEINSAYLRKCGWRESSNILCNYLDLANIYQRSPQKQSRSYLSFAIEEIDLLNSLRKSKFYSLLKTILSDRKYFSVNIDTNTTIHLSHERIYHVFRDKLNLLLDLVGDTDISDDLILKTRRALKTAYYKAGETGNPAVIVPSSLGDELNIFRRTKPAGYGEILAYFASRDFLANFIELVLKVECRNLCKIMESDFTPASMSCFSLIFNRIPAEDITKLHQEDWWVQFRDKFFRILTEITSSLSTCNINEHMDKNLHGRSLAELIAGFYNKSVMYLLCSLENLNHSIISWLILTLILKLIAPLIFEDRDFMKFKKFLKRYLGTI